MKTIQLTQGYIALVDDEDFERVNARRWHAKPSRSGRIIYASTNERRPTGGYKPLSMHQFITGEKGMDHQDGNGLNNQRYNLRPATYGQNSANARKSLDRSSRYKGVSWSIEHKKWAAEITCNYKRYFLGRFREECDAALAYNLKADELFGEFARFNIPLEATA